MSPGDFPDDLAVENALVAVDGTDESDRAVAYALEVAAEYDADFHALYVVGEEVGRAMEDDAVAEDSVAEESEAYLETVRERAAAAEVAATTATAAGFSTSVKTTHPGSVVLDVAEEVGADFLVVPREPLGDPEETLAVAAEYVLLYASQPVLSV